MTKYEAIKIAAREAGLTKEEIDRGSLNAAMNSPGVGNTDIPQGQERALIDYFKEGLLAVKAMTPEEKEQFRADYLLRLRQRTMGN